MVTFFIWLLVKIIVLVTVGYFLSKLITDTKTSNQLNNLGKQYQKKLIDNAYQNVHPDIELAFQIKGLNIHQQKYSPYQKPMFYFKLERSSTKMDIETFLQSLPQEFEVCIPALKISIEDSQLINVYFWRHLNQFQLSIKQNGSYTLLGLIGIEELTEKISRQSANFNFQNVSVERIINS